MDDTPLTFSRPPPAIQLPSDPADATAAVLAFVRGDTTHLPRAAMATMQDRVEALVDPTATESLQELARHLPTLEALWLRFAAEAVAATSASSRAVTLRMALQAQQAYARTFALVRNMALQQRESDLDAVTYENAADDSRA